MAPPSSQEISEPETQFIELPDDDVNLWDAVEIVAELGNKFKVKWDGIDPGTGKPWQDSWVLKHDATDDLVAAWREKHPRSTRKSKKASTHSSKSSRGGSKASTAKANQISSAKYISRPTPKRDTTEYDEPPKAGPSKSRSKKRKHASNDQDESISMAAKAKKRKTVEPSTSGGESEEEEVPMPKKAKRRVVQSAHESRASDNEMRTPLPPKSRPTPQSGRHFSSGTVTIDPPRKKAQGKPEGASVPPSPSEHDFNDFNDFDFSAPADDVPNVGKVIPKRGATKKNTVFVTKKQAKPTKFVAVDDDSEDRREEEGARQKTPMVTNKPRSRGLVERTDSFVLNPHSPLAQSANEATGLAKGLSKRLEARDSSGPLAPPKLAPVRDSSPKTLASAKNLGAPPPANKKTKNPGVLLPLPILPHTVSAVAGSPTRVCVPELELEELKRLEERLSPASKLRLKEFDDFWASLEEPPHAAEAPADDVVVNLPPKPLPARGGSIVPETDPGTSSQSQSQSQPSQSQQPPLPSQQQPPPSPRPTIKSSMKPRSPSKNGISSKSPELPDDYDDYPIDTSPPLFPNRNANNKGYSKSKKLGPIPVVSPSTFHPHLPPSSDRNSGDVDGDVEEEEEEEEEVEDTIDQFSPEKKDQANALRRIPIPSRKTRSRTVEVDAGVEAHANGDMDLDVDHSELQVKAPAVVHKSSEPSQRVIQSHANVISLSQDSDVIDREIRERGAQLADQARKERRAELGLKPRGENRRNLNHLLEQKDQVRDGAEDHVSPAANFVDATGETNRKSMAMDVNEGDQHIVDDEYDADREVSMELQYPEELPESLVQPMTNGHSPRRESSPHAPKITRDQPSDLDAQAEKKALLDEIASLKEKVSIAHASNESNLAQLKDAKAESHLLHARVEELLQENVALRSKLQESTAAFDDSRNKVEQLEQQNQKCSEDLANALSAKAYAEKDRDFLRQQYNTADGYASEVRKENIDLLKRAEIAERQASEGVALVKATFEEKLRVSEKQCEAFSRITEFMIKKDAATDGVRQQAAEAPELKARCIELEKELALVREDIERLETEMEVEQLRVEALEQEKERVEEEWHREVSGMNGDLRESRQQVAQLMVDLNEVKSKQNGNSNKTVFRCEWRAANSNRCLFICDTAKELEDHAIHGGHID